MDQMTDSNRNPSGFIAKLDSRSKKAIKWRSFPEWGQGTEKIIKISVKLSAQSISGFFAVFICYGNLTLIKLW